MSGWIGVDLDAHAERAEPRENVGFSLDGTISRSKQPSAEREGEQRYVKGSDATLYAVPAPAPSAASGLAPAGPDALAEPFDTWFKREYPLYFDPSREQRDTSQYEQMRKVWNAALRSRPADKDAEMRIQCPKCSKPVNYAYCPYCGADQDSSEKIYTKTDMEAACELVRSAGRKAEQIRLGKLVDRFLSWPLPESVCADLVATKQGSGRIGTNLLTANEAEQMLRYILGWASPPDAAMSQQEKRDG